MARAIVKNFGQPVKNYVINGSMQIAQRGSVTAANNTFLYGGCDRFAIGPFFAGGSSGGTIAQQVFTTGVLTQKMQAVVGLSNTGSGTVQFYTRLEGRDVARLNGKTVTWSMLAFQTSGLTLQFGGEINKPTVTDNYGAINPVTTFSAVSVPTNTITRVSFTYTFNSTDAEKGLELRCYFTVPSTLSSKSYYIGEMQLEESTYASPLEMLPYQVELSRCQRYYELHTGYGEFSFDNNVSASAGGFGWKFVTQKRTIPTVSVGSTLVANSRYYGPSGLRGINSVVASNTTVDGAIYTATLASAAVQFQGGTFAIVGGTGTDSLIAEAEL